MYPTDCYALPCIASPYRGLSSLSIYVADRWQHQQHLQTWQGKGSVSRSKAFRTTTDLNSTKDSNELNLPKDPRLWSREDVARWVQYVMNVHRLPSVQLDRFLMNGKALCLMTIDMFVRRVPLGGKLLYKDFQLRLSSALYS